MKIGERQGDGTRRSKKEVTRDVYGHRKQPVNAELASGRVVGSRPRRHPGRPPGADADRLHYERFDENDRCLPGGLLE